MFEKIYNLLSKVIVFLLLGMLIVGLTLWGVGDILNTSNSDVIAEVGELKVYNSEVENELMNVRSQLARQPIPQEQKDQIIELYRKSTIEQLINQKLLLNELSKMNIELDGKQIIKKDFVESPTYSADYLKSVIRQYGGEKLFIERLERDKKISIAENFFSSVNLIPEEIINKLHKHKKQKREISLIKFDKSLVKNVPNPSDSELISYYNKNKQNFLAPEFRSFSYISIKPESLNLEIEENEQSDLEERLYELSNLLLDKIAEGLSLKEISKELKLPLTEIKAINQKGISISGQQVENLPKAEEFLEQIFKYSPKEISDIVESRDGREYNVFIVDEIIDKRERAVDEVRSMVTKSWKEDNKISSLLEKAKEIRSNLVENKNPNSNKLLKNKGINVNKLTVDRKYEKLPKNILFEIFDKEVNGYTEIYPDNQGNLILAKINNVIHAEREDPIEYLETKNQIEDELSGEIISEYISSLSKKYKIKK